MMNEIGNMINIQDIDLDSPIYRVYKIDYLIENFRKKQDVLVRPNEWDDPFENFLLSCKIKYQVHFTLDPSTLKNDFYGQCWTLNGAESDALWRIYSPDKYGVRVKTTVAKLFDAFFDKKDPQADISYFMGKVEYKDINTIIDLLSSNPIRSNELFDQGGRTLINFLLLKRPEFDYENEVRIILHKKIGTDYYKYSIDPNNLYDEILFDPRFAESEFQKFKSDLVSFGFNKPIHKSKLYSVPDFTLNVID